MMKHSEIQQSENRTQNQIGNKNRQRGFTLVEMMVVIAVMGLLAGAAVINFRGAEKRKAVKLAEDVVVNAFRTAQTYSTSGKQIPSLSTKIYDDNSVGNCAAGSLVPMDYRLVFSANNVNYTIYAQDKCKDIWQVEQGKLPTKTRIRNTGVVLDGVTYAGLQVKFTPPFARLTASTTTGFGDPAPVFNDFLVADFPVEYSDGSMIGTVRVDAISGRIGEQ